MKYLYCFLLISFIAGCAHTVQMSSYRPSGSTEAAWKVKADKNSFTGNIEVTINDSVVCSGSIGMFNSGEELKGEYRGHKVTAMLQRTTSWLLKNNTVCLVMIDGELAGKFEW